MLTYRETDAGYTAQSSYVKSSKSLLTSQSDAEKREEQMGNMAVMHDKAKRGRVTGRGGWFYCEGTEALCKALGRLRNFT